jgi:hypothetical protein
MIVVMSSSTNTILELGLLRVVQLLRIHKFRLTISSFSASRNVTLGLIDQEGKRSKLDHGVPVLPEYTFMRKED